MEIVATSIASTSMQLGEDGLYYGTIPESTHGFGTDVFVVRALHRDSNMVQGNVLCAYEVQSNGDVKIFASEPTSIRVTLGKGTPSTYGLFEEGEEYADA